MTVGAALLIANTRYQSTSIFNSLRTPHGDAENLSDRLRALGFDTYVVHDAPRATLTSVIAQFKIVIEALPERASVFVYFAGHGLQRRGENYLVPVDANGASHTEVELACVRLSEIMNLLGGRKDQQKLIAIDACRTNRLPSATRDGASGLAGQSPQQYEDVHQTQVLYATEPGHLASDGSDVGSSPFCRGLLDAFKMPGAPILMLAAHVTNFVFEQTREMQTPWGTGNLRHLWPFVQAHDNNPAPVPLPEIDVSRDIGATSLTSKNRDVAERGRCATKKTQIRRPNARLCVLRKREVVRGWHWIVIFVPYDNARLLAEEMDEAVRERQAGFGRLLRVIEGLINSGWDIPKLSAFGTVIASGEGRELPHPIRLAIASSYGVLFDWRSTMWTQSNGLIEEVKVLQK